MIYLIERYSKLCLNYPQNTPEQIFNAMIAKCNDKETEFMADNFILFLKCAESARKSMPEVRKQIL